MTRGQVVNPNKNIIIQLAIFKTLCRIISHSATQPLSHSATQPLSHSATQVTDPGYFQPSGRIDSLICDPC